MNAILLYALTAALYAGLGAWFWRSHWHATAGAAAARGGAGERLAVLAPLALHSWLLYLDLFAGAELRFGFSQALSATLWLAVVFYWIESLYFDLAAMQAIVLPAAAVATLLPALFPGFATPDYAHQIEFRVHLAAAMVAYGLFTLAALHALLMSLLEKRLHHGSLTGPFASLPPLLTLETLLFRMLGLGFVLLTVTLGTGIVFHEQLFHRVFHFDHKTLFGILSWIIFGALLAGRQFYGWRGRRAIHWTMAGFLMLLLAYVGSRFVLEVILGRSLA